MKKTLTFHDVNLSYIVLIMYFLFFALLLKSLNFSIPFSLETFLLSAVPILVLGYTYKSEQGIRKFLRLNPISIKTAIQSISIVILLYPSIFFINKLFKFIVPVGVQTSIDLAQGLSLPEQVLSLVLLPGILEEILFRGFFLRGTEEKGKMFSIVYVALFFAFLHGQLANFISPFIFGIIAGILVYRTGSIFPAMLGHMAFNLTSVSILSFTPKDIIEHFSFVPTVTVSILLGIVALYILANLKTPSSEQSLAEDGELSSLGLQVTPTVKWRESEILESISIFSLLIAMLFLMGKS